MHEAEPVERETSETMCVSGNRDKTRQKQNLFTELIQECESSSIRSTLSQNLCSKIEKFNSIDLEDVVTQMQNGCAPLFITCKNGSARIAEYLLIKCNAQTEQRGLFQMQDNGSRHNVTPLWCAAVSGHVEIVKVLLKYGAKVDTMTDTGSTPLRSSCYTVIENGNSR